MRANWRGKLSWLKQYLTDIFFLIKADAVVDMIGFPDYIKDPKKLKEKYEGVSMINDTMNEQIYWPRKF